MKTKILILGLLVIFLFGCSAYRYSSNLVPEKTEQKIKAHRVAIAVHYEMSEEEYFRRKKQDINLRDTRALFVKEGRVLDALDVQARYLDIPLLIEMNEETHRVVIAYLGAGAIIKDNHVITVNHLFDYNHQYDTYSMHIWVLKEGIDHPIKATMVARTKCELITQGVHFNDYAVIKMEEDLGLPGLKIAKPGTLRQWSKVIYSGSAGGFAFFSRAGNITSLQYFFQKDYEGRLHLSFWEDFPYWIVYPGGPGDSGGPVTNIKGEIVTIMYCGMTVYSEEYIFGNPTQMIWDFLKEYNLEHLAR